MPPEGRSARRLIVTVIFGLLGLAANLPHITIFTGATLLFGGVFHLAIALLYGPFYGLIAAMITALPAVVLCQHPVTALILVLDAPVVGWLAQRRRVAPVVADLIYWAALGTPLAILLYVFLLNFPQPQGWVVAVKHPVNGLLNVLVAEILISLPVVQRYCCAASTSIERQPLRVHLVHGFLLVAAVPMMLLNIVNGQMYAKSSGDGGRPAAAGGCHRDPARSAAIRDAASAGARIPLASHHQRRALRSRYVN